MKTTKLILGLAAAGLFAAPAMAQDAQSYGTIGVKTIEFDTYSVEGRLGYNFTDFVAVEAQAAVGVISEDDEGVSINEDWNVGAFVKGSAPISEQFAIFARLGYAVTQFGVEAGSFDESESFDGFAFGAGVEFDLNPVSGVRLEYTAYDFGSVEDIDVGTADTVSLAYVRKF